MPILGNLISTIIYTKSDDRSSADRETIFALPYQSGFCTGATGQEANRGGWRITPTQSNPFLSEV